MKATPASSTRAKRRQKFPELPEPGTLFQVCIGAAKAMRARQKEIEAMEAADAAKKKKGRKKRLRILFEAVNKRLQETLAKNPDFFEYLIKKFSLPEHDNLYTYGLVVNKKFVQGFLLRRSHEDCGIFILAPYMEPAAAASENMASYEIKLLRFNGYPNTGGPLIPFFQNVSDVPLDVEEILGELKDPMHIIGACISACGLPDE